MTSVEVTSFSLKKCFTKPCRGAGSWLLAVTQQMYHQQEYTA